MMSSVSDPVRGIKLKVSLSSWRGESGGPSRADSEVDVRQPLEMATEAMRDPFLLQAGPRAGHLPSPGLSFLTPAPAQGGRGVHEGGRAEAPPLRHSNTPRHSGPEHEAGLSAPPPRPRSRPARPPPPPRLAAERSPPPPPRAGGRPGRWGARTVPAGLSLRALPPPGRKARRTPLPRGETARLRGSGALGGLRLPPGRPGPRLPSPRPKQGHAQSLTRDRHFSELRPRFWRAADFRPRKRFQLTGGGGEAMQECLLPRMDSGIRYNTLEEKVSLSSSDSESGNMDLQLSNLERIKKDLSNNPELTDSDISDTPGTSQKSVTRNIIYSQTEGPPGVVIIESMIKSIQDYLNGDQKSDVEKLTFLRCLSTLSRTLPYEETSELFIHKHLSEILDAITILIQQESLHSLLSPVRQEVFIAITDLSYQDINLLLGSEDKFDLFNVLIKSIITLPSIKTLNILQTVMPSRQYNTESLYRHTFQAFCEMLQCLVIQDPHLENLDQILEHMEPWLQSTKDHERERATASMSQLLGCLDRHLSLQPPLLFQKLGNLVALMALLCGDPVEEVAQEAAEGTYHLFNITLRLKSFTNNTRNRSNIKEAIKKCKEFPEVYSTKEFYSNPLRIAQVFEVFLNPNELVQFIVTTLDGLKNLKHPCTQQSAGKLLVTLVKCAETRFEKVSDIMEAICVRLPVISQPSARQQAMSIVSLFISKPKYTDVVLNHLLFYPIPFDRHLAELWRNIEADLPNTTWILWRLLRKLQKSHSVIQKKMDYVAVAVTHPVSPLLYQNPPVTDQVTDALYEVFVGNKLQAAMYRLFPQLLMALLIQIHHSIGITMSDVTGPKDVYTRQEMISTSTPLSLAIQATKTLLLRATCWYEFTTMEKKKGWNLLGGENFHLEGVSLLANVLLERHDFLANKVLYLLVPLLNQGNEKHKLTSTAFFVELFPSPLIKRLPGIYTITRLKEWLHHENQQFRILSLKGIDNLLCYHQRKVEAFKDMIPVILNSLSETNERIVLLSIRILRSLLVTMNSTTLKTTIKTLFSLFSDVRPNIHLLAVKVFGDSIKMVKHKDKKDIEDQILESLIPLILHLQDEDNIIAEMFVPNFNPSQESRRVLIICCQFLKWKLPREVYSKDPWYCDSSGIGVVCKFLEQKCRGKCNIMMQTMKYIQSNQVYLRRSAIFFTGLLAKYMDHSELRMKGTDWIEDVLRPLMHDPEPSVRIIASQALCRVQTAGGEPEPRPSVCRLRMFFSCILS
ncbi:protein MROH8 [Macrotis lagotis]|uniref:protein MROH8 n=1 Tax=Macrotis lagotis TaxID=92651 RepID=UPI003D690033